MSWLKEKLSTFRLFQKIETKKEKDQAFALLDQISDEVKQLTIEKWTAYLCDGVEDQNEKKQIEKFVADRLNKTLVFCDIFNTPKREADKKQLTAAFGEQIDKTQQQFKSEFENRSQVIEKVSENLSKFDAIFKEIESAVNENFEKLTTVDKRITLSLEDKILIILESAQGKMDHLQKKCILVPANVKNMIPKIRELSNQCEVDVSTISADEGTLMTIYPSQFVNLTKQIEEVLMQKGAKKEWLEGGAGDDAKRLEEHLGEQHDRTCLFEVATLKRVIQNLESKNSEGLCSEFLPNLPKHSKWRTQNWNECYDKIKQMYESLKNELGFIYQQQDPLMEYFSSKSVKVPLNLMELLVTWREGTHAFASQNREKQSYICFQSNVDEQTLGHESGHVLQQYKGEQFTKQRVGNQGWLCEAMNEYYSQKAFNPNYDWQALTRCDYKYMIFLLHDLFDSFEQQAKKLYYDPNGLANDEFLNILGKEEYEQLLQHTDNYFLSVSSFINSIDHMCSQVTQKFVEKLEEISDEISQKIAITDEEESILVKKAEQLANSAQDFISTNMMIPDVVARLIGEEQYNDVIELATESITNHVNPHPMIKESFDAFLQNTIGFRKFVIQLNERIKQKLSQQRGC